MIATCSVQTVPYTWVRQTQPGGIILTPWGTTFDISAVLRLTVDENGDQAVGRIIDGATFMILRAQRPMIPDDFDVISERSRTESISPTFSARMRDSASACMSSTAR